MTQQPTTDATRPDTPPQPRDAIRDDAHSDYHAAKRAAAQAMVRGVWKDRFPQRFEPLSQRQMRCDMPRAAIDAIAHGKHFSSYRGLPMAKDPFDRVLYETLLFELRPRTVIELGAYTGASALWMADVMRTIGAPCRVIAADLDLELVDDSARLNGAVEFLEGDLNDVGSLFPAELLSGLEGPVVLIDDAHVSIQQVYDHFDSRLLKSGDYLIVEDTIPWIPGAFGADAGAPASEEQPEWGDWKGEEVQRFFDNCDSDYEVDRYYTDFYGYNGTWNWNGYLRKQ